MESPPASFNVDDDVVVPAPGDASILMVDDHPPNLLSLEAVLAPLGHRLVPVTSGRQALAELLNGDFAVILLDVQMADMDGFETASLIKAHKRAASIPLIFITAFDRDAENIFTGYARGGVDYLLKPVDPDILRSKVKVFVELYQRGQTIRAQQALIRRQELARLEARHERRFRNVLESMPLPVWGARTDGKVDFASRAWRDYAASNPEAGASLLDPATVHPDDLRNLERAWATAIAKGAPFAIECQLRRSDGAYRWHVFRAAAELGETGAVEGWIVTATDIDDHRRRDEERSRLLALEKSARADAERANTAKDVFLATVSHELRTPLNAIVGWARLLASGKVRPERIPTALETIQRNAFAQARLVDDLLDVSRIVFGKLDLCMESTAIAPIVRAAVDGVRPAADAKNVTLICVAEGDDVVLADPARLQQVIGNLLVNGVKFNQAGGHVEVRLARTEDAFEITVADTGRGIAPELLPQIFDRFRQADRADRASVEGLGLGLAVVEQLVRLHGGTITAASSGVGGGAKFTVRLPIPADAGPRTRDSVRAPPIDERSSLQGMRLLTVDDEDDARLLLAEILRYRGAVVTPLASAREVLEFLETNTVDALISDIGMPERDGYSLIRAIRETEKGSDRHLPAIAMTAYAYEADRRRALDAGFDRHMSKPFDIVALVDALTALVGEPPGGIETE